MKVEDVVLEPLASAEAVLTGGKTGQGLFFWISAAGRPCYCFQNGSACYAFVIPVSGYQVTRDISIATGISFDMAEQIKIKYGSVMPFNSSLPAQRHRYWRISISQNELSKSLPRMEELLRLVMIELSEIDLIIEFGFIEHGDMRQVR